MDGATNGFGRWNIHRRFFCLGHFHFCGVVFRAGHSSGTVVIMWLRFVLLTAPAHQQRGPGSSQTTPNLNVATNRRFNVNMNDSTSHDENDMTNGNGLTVNALATLRRQNTNANSNHMVSNNNRRPILGNPFNLSAKVAKRSVGLKCMEYVPRDRDRCDTCRSIASHYLWQ